MKVLHIITHFDMGGAERVAANIAKSDTLGIDYHIMEVLRGHSAYTPKFLAELRQAGIHCHRSIMPDIRFHFIAERIAALLFPLRFIIAYLRLHPDIIHVHTETADLCIYTFTKLFPMLHHHRIVRTIHNTRLWTGLPRTALRVEKLFINSHANVAISPQVAASYAKRFGEMPPIIYNGVPQSAQKAYPHLVPHSINVLFAGRMEPQKGINTLIEVVSQLGADSGYTFHIAGNGTLRGKVEEALGRQPNVRLTDAIYGLSEYMTSFDYLFMPSEFEGLSMLSMEASLNGLPVIANDCPGLADTLPPQWPLKVQGNSVTEYLHLFCDTVPTASRQALAAKSYAYAAQRFTIDIMQHEYEKLYAARTDAEQQ